MPLKNRVTPFGEIVAVAGRGTMMGNRGILHNDQRVVVRDWQVRRWIACQLEFRGRHRAVMTPGSYTELFFLDEATALADGHRPCAECRHADYIAFQDAWRAALQNPTAATNADAIDAVLHAQRRTAPRQKRTFQASIASLPDGTYVAIDDRAWLIWQDALLRWSPEAYVDRVRRPSDATVTVLTPKSMVSVLLAGYRSGVHPTASG